LNDVNYAFLWDLDGTIVDTKDCHFFTWESALHKHGFELDRDIFEKNFGRNNYALAPLLLGFDPDADLLEALIDHKETLFRQIAPEQTDLVPGVRTWLSTAAEMDIKQAIASSAPMENITTMLAHFELERYFNTIVSGTNLPAKPEPDVFLKAAKDLRCSPADCLVIEDSLAGVKAAKNAGMHCVAVTTIHAREELHQADIVVDDFKGSLRDILQSLGWV
jgi:beta-phosphoglucomutase